jgi:hypothetical protein
MDDARKEVLKEIALDAIFEALVYFSKKEAEQYLVSGGTLPRSVSDEDEAFGIFNELLAGSFQTVDLRGIVDGWYVDW